MPLQNWLNCLLFEGANRCLSEPAVATQRLRQQVVMPLRDIVVAGLRVLAEQALDQIATVVQKEDDRLQAETVKLADLLCGELVGALPVTSTVRICP